jgi:hypothetical protein
MQIYADLCKIMHLVVGLHDHISGIYQVYTTNQLCIHHVYTTVCSYMLHSAGDPAMPLHLARLTLQYVPEICLV